MAAVVVASVARSAFFIVVAKGLTKDYIQGEYFELLQGVLFGMKPYKMLVLPICMAKQVKFVEFRPNEDFSSICVFFYISMSNF